MEFEMQRGPSLRDRTLKGSNMAFKVTTPAFHDGENIPSQFTCDGTDKAPELNVSDPPKGTRSFALIMDDPDAPKGVFTHWVVYDIPADGGALAVAQGNSLDNSFGRSGYGGPCPPAGHGPHRYIFTVYAVDVPSLGLKGGGRQDLEAALKTHTLGTARLMGRYERAG
jgi:Raf kinase inhibitor-like YbhB/YbcL family protein